MTFEFGSFRLDEAGRVLHLKGREIPLQPRVFDLLVYLVHRRERVVSKDELLDALWTDVTVTDNSLQRAVSLLRGVMRDGGLPDAIRNFPRSGYRFCFEPEDCAHSQPARAPAALDQLALARQAAAQQCWSDAIKLFEASDAGDKLEGEDLDRWALALQCVGRPSDAIPVHVRAAVSHTRAGDIDLAAASSVALATIHLERGEAALAQGWLARAQDLVATRPDSPSAGIVLWMASRAAAFEGNLSLALELTGKAYELGRQSGCVKVECLGLMYRGFYRLSLGETRAGLQDQDHAAALALSNQLDPITGGVLYCNILWACRTFGDWARATQWTLGYREFCTNSGMQFSGSCQLHRAEVLAVQGSLLDALSHIEDALMRLSSDAPWALGDAHRVLGDIQAAIGNTDSAFAAYEKSYALGWNPEPGLALLLVEQGDLEAAFTGLERSLIGQSWWTLQRQGMLLAHLAVIAASSGRHDKAESLIRDLAGQEERWPMASIRALTNEASAILARERGKAHDALRHLYLARQLWSSIDSRLNAARLRLQIAALQIELGDATGAQTEIRTARIIADELKSEKLLRQCRALEDRLENSPAD